MLHTSPLRSLLPPLLAVLAAGCSGQGSDPTATSAPPPTAAADAAVPAEPAATSQITLSSVIRLEPEAFDGFLATMRANAGHARSEPGAISFDVFQPEDGSPTLVLFERWADPAALDAHMQQPTLKAVLAALPEATSTAPTDLALAEVPPSGADSRRQPADPASSRNIIVHLSVKPEREADFLAAWAEVIPQARQAPGNAVFELYRDTAAAQRYVLLERWDSVAAHEAHLAAPYSRKLDAVLPDTLAAPIVDGENRFVLRDLMG